MLSVCLGLVDAIRLECASGHVEMNSIHREDMKLRLNMAMKALRITVEVVFLFLCLLVRVVLLVLFI